MANAGLITLQPMTINIGCGITIFSSVNVDLEGPGLDLKCDAHALPFRAKSFKKAFLHHVLEHVRDPVKVLDEALRAASIVEIRTPWRFHPYAHIDASHVSWFTGGWFKKYAESRGLRVSGQLVWDVDRSFFYFGIEWKGWLFP